MKVLSTTLMVSLLLGAAILPACSPGGEMEPSRAELVTQESARLNSWFTARYEEALARSPMNRTYLGDRSGQDQLDDISQLALDEGAALRRSWLQELRRDFDIDRLDPQTRLSYQLFEHEQEDWLATHAVSA
ncbi:MAG: hypothetical protein AAF926_08170, partial [Pseudomonadota bacterium]